MFCFMLAWPGRLSRAEALVSFLVSFPFCHSMSVTVHSVAVEWVEVRNVPEQTRSDQFDWVVGWSSCHVWHCLRTLGLLARSGFDRLGPSPVGPAAGSDEPAAAGRGGAGWGEGPVGPGPGGRVLPVAPAPARSRPA